ADYEVMYYLDENNFELLLDSIGISKKDKLKNHLIIEFDNYFYSNKFYNFCNDKFIFFIMNIHILYKQIPHL
ncbi:hypothetical protein, partial [Streptococcus dysgalactiae]|uniref:hypothetical protein n=1 Tax=Streptococcus dysgalactiae TaxID=1334 RepID=UPI001E3D999E